MVEPGETLAAAAERETPLALQAEEITGVFWLDPAEAVARHAEAGRARLAAALEARATNTTIYLDAVRTL